jgi:hypothetical protein
MYSGDAFLRHDRNVRPMRGEAIEDEALGFEIRFRGGAAVVFGAMACAPVPDGCKPASGFDGDQAKPERDLVGIEV